MKTVGQSSDSDIGIFTRPTENKFCPAEFLCEIKFPAARHKNVLRGDFYYHSKWLAVLSGTAFAALHFPHVSETDDFAMYLSGADSRKLALDFSCRVGYNK